MVTVLTSENSPLTHIHTITQDIHSSHQTMRTLDFLFFWEFQNERIEKICCYGLIDENRPLTHILTLIYRKHTIRFLMSLGYFSFLNP